MRDYAGQFDTDISTPQVGPLHPQNRKASFRPYRDIGKRTMDLILSGLLLIAILPLLAVLIPLARRDGGPGFYTQPRVGRDGKEFQCYKLRTMVVDAEALLKRMCDEDPELAREWHENQKLADDPRITKAGRFLRATSLDELPQIFNVIKGDMSLVGPRPFMPDQNDLYWQAGGRAYYDVRPGITGPWQVEGRGQTSFVSRVGFDERYLHRLSLRGDLGYLVKTIGVVLQRTGH